MRSTYNYEVKGKSLVNAFGKVRGKGEPRKVFFMASSRITATFGAIGQKKGPEAIKPVVRVSSQLQLTGKVFQDETFFKQIAILHIPWSNMMPLSLPLNKTWKTYCERKTGPENSV